MKTMENTINTKDIKEGLLIMKDGTKLSFKEPMIKDEDWVMIDYSVIPKEIFDKYGAKPFQIMKRKMRKDGEVWANITWSEAKEEAKKLGYRLPSIQEMLVLLHAYKEKYPTNANVKHDEFLGIEELSYDQDVNYEWIDAPVPYIRGGYWGSGANGGVFTLYLLCVSGNQSSSVGVRCVR